MKYLIVPMLMLLSFCGSSQTVKMSAFPEISTIQPDYFLPVFRTGTNNYKMNVATFFNERFNTKSTTNLIEGTNQYFTIARARAAISGINGITYNNTTGAISPNLSFFDSRYTFDLQLGQTLNYGEVLNVDLLQIHRNKKNVGDANYTLTPMDELLILPKPSATRTFTLIPADQMKGLHVTIIHSGDLNGQWLWGGVGYIEYGTTMPPGQPYVTNNPGVMYAKDRTRLESFLDIDGVWKWIDTK